MKVRENIFFSLQFLIEFFFQQFVIQQRDSIEPFFKNYLIEDKGFTGGASYVDFLYHLHREIRNILQ
jgi:protein transport protein SEC24